MKIPEVKKYLKKNQFAKTFKVSHLPHGHNNWSFLIEAKRKKYVLQTKRLDTKGESHLENEAIVLKFLEQEKINFVPKCILYDNKNDIIIETYVGNKDFLLGNLNKKQINLTMKHMNKLNSIDHKKFIKFCKKNKHKPIKASENAYKSIKKWGINRFQLAKKNQTDKHIIDWIEPRLKANVENIKKNNKYQFLSFFKKKKLYFTHGDMGDNFRVGKNSLHIIDWESAKLSRYENGLPVFAFVHGKIKPKQQEYMIKSHAKKTKTSIKKIRKNVYNGMKEIMVNDVIWAAMRYSEMRTRNEKSWKKYYNITLQRIKKYEDMFENS